MIFKQISFLFNLKGTGKSTVVCAICLGLAGGTKLLGRANEVSAWLFITIYKVQCTRADLEILK